MPFLSGIQKNTRKFFDPQDKMMYEWGPWWVSTAEALENEWGDALWRTSLAYIAYPTQKEIKEGILSCFVKGSDGFYQAHRATGKGADTVSRDQVLMALVALKVNGDIEELRDIASHLRFKLSKEHKFTLGLWVWTKWLGSGGRACLALCQTLFFFQLLMMYLWNGALSFIIGSKATSQKDLAMSEAPAWKRRINKVVVPSYAVHLAAWQVYVLPDGLVKKILSKFIVSLADSSNYLIHIMMGKEVNKRFVDKYLPMSDFRWQRNLDDGLWEGSPYILPPGEASFNALDVDVLARVKNDYLCRQ